jgi:hypothetical protein
MSGTVHPLSPSIFLRGVHRDSFNFTLHLFVYLFNFAIIIIYTPCQKSNEVLFITSGHCHCLNSVLQRAVFCTALLKIISLLATACEEFISKVNLSI